MTVNVPAIRSLDETSVLRLAREVAMDALDINQILQRVGVSEGEWQQIKEDPQFQKCVANLAEEWHSATNTVERTRVKAAIMVEMYLEEAWKKLHSSDTLTAPQVELVKHLSKIGGHAGPEIHNGVAGEKFSVTINLGSDRAITIEKELPPRVIEAEPVG